ncbi:glycosyltransferase family 2 protein [Sphingomonas psychrolutea]|uniref:Glycosyltransferase 2-like domain-containing protein n=1 Tax=Sphingomonas psychrolutea TaxID=1259676 RepID=A0ABQ1FZU9_9SPHN|nr:glycosyltransferase family 2 protein [Sphingomonas psychrolutea]GGA34166.1 hypothetical protein GCM10011395_00580 [Sphingomonas psychrolutea]
MQVSAVVLTFNEEINIGRCLTSLAWCDDVVVIDSGSTDRTIAICAEHGVRVVQNPFVNFAEQRNFALETVALRHEWILHIDADEEVTPAFRAALAALTPPRGIFGYRAPSRTLLFGQWLKRSGMYPSYQVRIGHRAQCTFRQHGHGQRETLPPDQIGLFDVPYDHHAFSHGLVKWFIKHVGYARAEADQILHAAPSPDQRPAADATSRRRALKQAANHMPPALRPLARFAYLAFWRRGLLDGPAGLCYCLMSTAYETMIAVFLMEARIKGRP